MQKLYPVVDQGHLFLQGEIQDVGLVDGSPGQGGVLVPDAPVDAARNQAPAQLPVQQEGQVLHVSAVGEEQVFHRVLGDHRHALVQIAGGPLGRVELVLQGDPAPGAGGAAG